MDTALSNTRQTDRFGSTHAAHQVDKEYHASSGSLPIEGRSSDSILIPVSFLSSTSKGSPHRSRKRELFVIIATFDCCAIRPAHPNYQNCLPSLSEEGEVNSTTCFHQCLPGHIAAPSILQSARRYCHQ